MGARRLVFDFVDVIPGRWVANVGVALGLALRKNREQGVRGFERGRTEVEAMELGQIRLVARGCGECPILEEDPIRVGSCAKAAKGTRVPAMDLSSGRSWWTSD